MSLETHNEEFSGEIMWYPGYPLKYLRKKRKKENGIDEVRPVKCW